MINLHRSVVKFYLNYTCLAITVDRFNNKVYISENANKEVPYARQDADIKCYCKKR